MVSLAAYQITEFVFFIGFFYVLWLLTFMAWLAYAIIEGKKLLYGILIHSVILVAGLIVLLSSVRLGTVLFMDGILFAMFCVYSVKLGIELKERIHW
jgi:hypothetical protein